MGDLEELIRSFRDRTAELLQEVRKYTIPLDNVVVLGAVGWKKTHGPIPFADSMVQLEKELEKLHGALTTSDANRIYKRVRPAYRCSPSSKHIWGYYKGDDAISVFSHEQHMMVVAYFNKDGLIIEDPYKDIFLKRLVGDVFDTHYMIRNEKFDRTAPEVKKASVEMLRNLQSMFNVDVYSLFESYSGLLVDIHEALLPHTEGIPTYAGVMPRRIPRVDTSVISDLITFPGDPKERQDYLRDMAVAVRDMNVDEKALLIPKLLLAEDWGELLTDVVEIIKLSHADPLEKYSIFEPDREKGIRPVEDAERAERCHIVGQDRNVERLEELLRAFVAGEQVPFILLHGETGTGKSLTVQYLTYAIEGLKTVLLHSGYLGAIRNFAKEMSERPWHTVLYIDDMGFDPRQYESFKTGTQGMRTFPRNVLPVVSANQEAVEPLPYAIKRRFPIRLKYENLKMKDDSVLGDVFEANCRRLGLSYDERAFGAMKQGFDVFLKENELKSNPAAVYDYLVEQKALHKIT